MIIPEDGCFLLIDKPLHWTSFDVVKKLKYAIKPKKIGHSGTLDPLATGLLVIGVNKFTKKLNEVQGLDKTYEGIFEIGRTTPSYDLETEFDSEKDYCGIGDENLESARQHFLGVISQMPPVYSAIKVNGERAYEKARRNENVDMKSREVTIHSFEIESYHLPEIHFRINCSKGTYIRSLAHDFGQILGPGAYLKALRRTAIGDFHVKDAHNLDELVVKLKKSGGGI